MASMPWPSPKPGFSDRDQCDRRLNSAYSCTGSRTAAYPDETYRVEREGPTYYVMVAAVVQADQRDRVRAGVRGIVGSRYWHTAKALRARRARYR